MNGTEIPGANAISYTATEDGNYSVLVTDANACSVLSEEINIVLTSLYEIEGLSSVSLFPNPVNTNINLELMFNRNATMALISLFDILGNKMFEVEHYLHNGKNSFEFDLAKFPSGVYYLNMNVEGENINLSLIKN